MQQLKIPQSPFVTNNGMVASEWLVFLNELIRLGNLVINSDTIEKADDAEFASVERPTLIGFDIAAANSQHAESVAITVKGGEIIEVVPIYTNSDAQSIDNVPLQISQDKQSSDNPYAQMSAIEQQLHDQQIWSLTV